MLTSDPGLALLVMEQRYREAEEYGAGRELTVTKRRPELRWLQRLGELMVVAGRRLRQDGSLQAQDEARQA